MELEQMKSSWLAMEQQLMKLNATHQFEQRKKKTRRAQRSLWPMLMGGIIELVIGLLICFASASFWAQHISQTHLLIYGLSLHAYGICMVGFSGVVLYQIYQTDFSHPVVDIQQRVSRIRYWYACSMPFWFVTGCIIWLPALLIVFYWLGADLWLHKPSIVYWFLVNSVFSMLLFAAPFIIAKVFNISKLSKWLADVSVPRSLKNAEQALRDIEAFKQD